MKVNTKMAVFALLICSFVLLSGCPQAGEAGRGLAGPEVVVPGGSGVHPPCTDSDGGRNYNVKGTATGASASQPQYLITSFTDNCTVDGKIVEYYCDDIWVKSVTDNCPTGSECRDGACIPKAPQGCSENDGGNKPLVAGTCIDAVCGAGCKDACAGTSAVQEYYCEQGKCVTGPHGCDVECKNAGYASGKCSVNAKGEGYCECAAPEPKCSDTDGGPNFYVGGVCSDSNGNIMPDRCAATDTDILFEASCITKDGPCVAPPVLCGQNCRAKGYAGGKCTTDEKGLGYCKCSKQCWMQLAIIKLDKCTSGANFKYDDRTLYYASDCRIIVPSKSDYNFTMASTPVTTESNQHDVNYLEKFNSLPGKTMYLKSGEFNTDNYALLPNASGKVCKYIAYIPAKESADSGNLYLYKEGVRP